MSSAKLGNRMKQLRARDGLTQQDVAERIEVTRKTINTIENGVFVPSTILALKLAHLFAVPVEDVFYLPSNNLPASR